MHTYFMDSALENIQIIKQYCDLHIMLELSPDSLNSTVMNLSGTKLETGIHGLWDVLDDKSVSILREYFNGVTEVNYVYYPSARMITYANVKASFQILSYLKKHGIEAIHFDTISGRAMPILPFLFGKNLIATIHDPKPHKGEETLKRKLVDIVYYFSIKKYVFYSSYSLQEFKSIHSIIPTHLYTGSLLPYTYITHFPSRKKISGDYILFFGRLSHYKGIDLLLDALPSVFVKNPNIKVIIAGKGDKKYQFPTHLLQQQDRIQFIDSYLSISDLAGLIYNSKFVVCPYREATQSGVLMTAFALKKPVLATSVGAFPEYLNEHENGLLVLPDIISLANGINTMLKNDYYHDLEMKMKKVNVSSKQKQNLELFSKLYA